MRPTTRASMAVVVLFGVVAVFHILPPECYAGHIGMSEPSESWENGTDGLYEATATVMGLVSFGSFVGIKLSTNRERAGLQRGGLIMIFGCNIIMVLIQSSTMLGICCLDIHMARYAVYIQLTAITLMGMLFGYAMIFSAQNKEVRQRRTRRRDVDTATKNTTDTNQDEAG